MAIVKIQSSKATPRKVIDYITERGKASYVNVLNLDVSRDLAQQMMETAKLWGKALGETSRKYYHLKISFAIKDWVENGGTLTEAQAMKIGMAITREFFPGHEAVGSVHIDKAHLHFHGVVSAVNLETGQMVDMRNAEYAKLKDRVQEICMEQGLTAIDWRKATKEKRAKEAQTEEPVKGDTLAEQGLKARGEVTWKDQLRAIVDQAAAECCSMDEFRAYLESQGVTLTRCTEQTISYKFGDHRACRGDTLGADYTARAIQDALQHNLDQETKEETSTFSLDARLKGIESGSNYKKEISQEERQAFRELGRLAGLRRAEIDEFCDQAPKATWEEKKAAWAAYTDARNEFWDEYAIRQKALQAEINSTYKRRRRLKNAEWALDIKNRRKSLIGVVYALIVLNREGSTVEGLDRDIERLKKAKEKLRQDMKVFKIETGTAVDTLRQKGLSLDEYMETVSRMQAKADQIQIQNDKTLSPKEKEKFRLQAEKERERRKKASPPTGDDFNR